MAGTKLTNRVTTRIYALILMSTGWRMEDIIDTKDFSHVALYKIWKRAISQEFNLFICSKVTTFYIENASKFVCLGINMEEQIYLGTYIEGFIHETGYTQG